MNIKKILLDKWRHAMKNFLVELLNIQLYLFSIFQFIVPFTSFLLDLK